MAFELTNWFIVSYNFLKPVLFFLWKIEKRLQFCKTKQLKHTCICVCFCARS